MFYPTFIVNASEYMKQYVLELRREIYEDIVYGYITSSEPQSKL